MKPTIDSILGYNEPTPVTIKLVPAYGRNYQTEAEALKDWNAGKDFKIAGGPYCSIRDARGLKIVGDKLAFLGSTGNLLSTLVL